jgi:hypothetical protein
VPCYPIVNGYSDFVVVPHSRMDPFLHYCGVFSSTNLFSEFAIPTCLVFRCDFIRTFKDGPSFKPGDMWTDEPQAFARKYDFDLQRLMREFPEDLLYVHPDKLSKWTWSGLNRAGVFPLDAQDLPCVFPL